jgi:hypothetical protein
MAFSSALVGRDVFGTKCVTYGTFTGTGVATGDIKTYLHTCQLMLLQPNNTASPTEQCDVSTALPLVVASAGNPVTIVMTSGVCGYWMAFGDAFI